ncbi:Lipase family protein [Perkinsela sp. CCAP 1560/4]|nr:Lipase family protein [Perkinsela sp. CCAP 1560/4]|eukprot:KNH06975.1 Lipase family protein [Perkinsela sp. CCAP 1560/4]
MRRSIAFFALLAAFSFLPIVEGAASKGKASPESSYIYSFPYTYSWSDLWSRLHIDGRVEEDTSDSAFRRIGILQSALVAIWDTLFRTSYLRELVCPLGSCESEQIELPSLSPHLYNADTVSRAIGLSKLSFCQEKRVRSGKYYRNPSNQNDETSIDIHGDLVESYTTLRSHKYALGGYVIVYRNSPSSMKRRVAVVFHAVRNDSNTMALFAVGMHRYTDSLGPDGMNIYLGWHALMVEILPQLKRVMQNTFFNCNGSPECDPEKYIETIEEVLFTGPCVGGVLAELSALYMHDMLMREKLAREYIRDELRYSMQDVGSKDLHAIQKRFRVYTFGALRAGNGSFARHYNLLLGNQTFRIVNEGDGKVLLPYNRMGFYHVGQEAFFRYDQQVKGGEGNPNFQEQSNLGDFGEDTRFGYRGWIIPAHLPFLERHMFYFDRSIMHCFRNPADE